MPIHKDMTESVINFPEIPARNRRPAATPAKTIPDVSKVTAEVWKTRLVDDQGPCSDWYYVRVTVRGTSRTLNNQFRVTPNRKVQGQARFESHKVLWSGMVD